MLIIWRRGTAWFDILAEFIPPYIGCVDVADSFQNPAGSETFGGTAMVVVKSWTFPGTPARPTKFSM